VYFLIVTQLTIFSVTLYLHRSQAHRGVDFHPALAHFFRFWSWISTGMVTKEWVAIHRKHHAKCETEEDPHSPKVFGIKTVVLQGVDLYRVASHDKSTMDKYGIGTPTDWLERNLYGSTNIGARPDVHHQHRAVRHPGRGDFRAADDLDSVLAAGVVNGLGHWWGYRNFETTDMSTNLTPWGFFIGGEELHNNHHAFPSSSKFALRKFEFDIGWAVIRGFEKIGLAKAARGAEPGHPSERATAGYRDAEGAAEPSLPGHDRLFPRRDHADAARRSRPGRRQAQVPAACAAQRAGERRPLA
jgi:stearoyl-CoA desaturase (delta-9 desaturase)